MKTAVVIPTLNAADRGKWQEVLAAVTIQKMPVARKIIIDSSSDDSTCAQAAAGGWECRTIRRQDFNHGTVRSRITAELAADGVDTVVFLSQDVVPATPDALQKLTGFLWSRPVAGCYGKQYCLHEGTLNAWQRRCCYPPESAVKTLRDVPEQGLMTPFFSNAFAAWKTAEVLRYGGFPETDFGEDMLLAAAVLNQQGAVGYCAEAMAIHDHSNGPAELFRRGMQIGRFHRIHPELIQQFGGVCGRLRTPVPWSIRGALAIKASGYLCGRYPYLLRTGLELAALLLAAAAYFFIVR